MNAPKQNFSIAIIGGGLAGMCMGIQLRAQGWHNFTIFEKAEKLGGTWRDNTYPGVACDVPSHLYSYSFARAADWSHIYADGAEIQNYCEDVARRFGILPHCQFGQRVTELVFTDGRWRLGFATGEPLYFNAVISAVGALHRPLVPPLIGQDEFQGASFHSAEWNHNVETKGKKIAVIGSAASAVQIVPELAKQAKQLYVFQRTPNWMLPRHNWRIPELAKNLMRRLPFLSLLYRLLIFLAADMLIYRAFKQNSLMQNLLRWRALAYLRRAVPDANLRAQLTPDYPIGCKRILPVEGYVEALQCPHVSLITTPIQRITARGIMDEAGQIYEADMIIYATGFDTGHIVKTLKIKGLDGLSLKRAWSRRKGTLGAHRTVAIAGFPNFFMLLGPNSGLGFNSVLVMIEAQTRYIIKCLTLIQKNGWRNFRPRRSAHIAFTKRIQKSLKTKTWNGNCASWYKSGRFGDSDENYFIWPFSARQFIKEMRHVDLAEYEYEDESAESENELTESANKNEC